MLRIILASVGLVVLLFSGGAMAAKQTTIFETPAAVEGNEAEFMLLAQNNDEGTRQRCNRRDRPPLSS